MSKAEIKAAQDRGATMTVVPKQVAGTLTAPDLVAAMNEFAQAQLAGAEKHHNEMLNAIQKLTSTLAKKELEPQELSVMLESIKALGEKSMEHYEPADYRIDFERDQKSLIKSGLTIKAIPRVLN